MSTLSLANSRYSYIYTCPTFFRVIKLNLSYSSPDPELAHHTSFFVVTLALSTNWLWKIALSQSSIQKLLAVPTINKARICLAISCIGIILMKMLSCFLGLVIYAWFASCDPLLTGQIKKHEQVISSNYFSSCFCHSISF